MQKKRKIFFENNLSKISKKRFKSEDPKSALKHIKTLYESWEKVIKLFDDHSPIISRVIYKTKHAELLKILTTKQILQRLPIALAQVKACNTSKNLLNEIRQLIYSLYRSKEINKKVYNNIVDLIQKMNTIFMNSENSRRPDPRRILPNLTDKSNLRRKNKYIVLSNLSILVFIVHGKI